MLPTWETDDPQTKGDTSVVPQPASGLAADVRGRGRTAAARPAIPVAAPRPQRARQKMSDSTLQRAVRNAVDEITGVDDRLRVTQTMAAPGWGDVLFVDLYAKSQCDVLEDLDPALRKLVAMCADWPFERVTIRWRITR
jgi:hypothetical protein